MLSVSEELRGLQKALERRYELRRELGHGAYATVFLAQDLRHDRPVALKVLRDDRRDDENEIRFAREIKFLARLQHPNILPLLDSGHALDAFYYVSPFVEGMSLRERIDRERRLPIEDAVRIAYVLAEALEYAHRQGVIHRDVKPENVLLSGSHPLLADFGVARAMDPANGSRLTRPGLGGPGTPAYMSPEQLMGDRPIDARADLYSLACVLYEMLAGTPPFAGKAGFVQRFEHGPPAISTARPDVPAWLERAITRALQREPRDRFATAGEMAAALVTERDPTPATSPALQRRPIPVPSAPLVGRARELAEIAALLEHHRLVTLVGPGGVGKSRLALQIAADRSHELPDGSVVVQLVTVTSPELLISSIAESLGIVFSGGRNPRLQLLDALRERQLLLVLDGMEHLLGAADLVIDLVQYAQRLRLLVTSRERLNLGDEAAVEVRGLEVVESGSTRATDPAIELFVDRAKKADPRFTPSARDLDAIRRIGKAVGGLPLGIEIAASLARVLSCDEIATELERDPGGVSTSRRDLPERHRSLRLVFEQSWGALNETEKAALMRISVFRGDFGRDAGLRAAGAPLPVLTSLLDKSLVQRTTAGRFQLHEVVQQFAEVKLREHPELLSAAEDARSEYFAARLVANEAALFGPELYTALDAIGEDLESIKAGWRRAISRDRDDLVAGFLPSLYRYYLIRGRYAEAETELAQAEQRGKNDTLAALILARRASLSHLTNPSHARKLVRRAINILQDRDPTSVEMGIALRVLAPIASDQGRLRAAKRLFLRALRLLRDRAPVHELGGCLTDWGTTQLRLGEYEDAVVTYREGERLAIQAGEPRARIVALSNLAVTLNELGRSEEALELRRETLTIARQFRDDYLLAGTLANLGDSLIALRKFDEARAVVNESRHLFQGLGMAHGVSFCEKSLAQIDRCELKLGSAEEHLRSGLRLANAIGTAVPMFEAVLEFARLREAQGQPATAARLASVIAYHPAASTTYRRVAQEFCDRLIATGETAADQIPRTHKAGDLELIVHELTK